MTEVQYLTPGVAMINCSACPVNSRVRCSEAASGSWMPAKT